MASKRRAAPIAAPRPKPVSPVVPPLDVGDLTVAQLTRDILELCGASGKRSVTARAEIGRLLLQVQQHLDWGDWRPWLSRHVPFTARTAERAIALHQLRQSAPQRFARLAPLGVSKANVLVTLPPALVDELFGKAHTVPGTTIDKTVLAMTFAELMQVISSLQAKPDDAASALVHAYQRQIRALIRTVDALIEDRQHIAEDELVDMHDDLLDALSRLAEAFDLDEG